MPPGRRKKPGLTEAMKNPFNRVQDIDTPADYSSQIPRYIPNKPDYISQIPRYISSMTPAQLAPTSFRNPVGGGSGSGGSSGGSIPVGVAGYDPITADLSKNPYPGAYDQLLAFVQSSLASRPADFDAAKATMSMQQEQANKQMYDSYMNSRQTSDASSTALGVDPAVVSAARDLAMRKNQENSDQGLADNLAWVDKAKLLQGDELGYASRSIAADKLSKSLGWEDAEAGRVADINALGLETYQKALLASLENHAKSQKEARDAASKGGNSSGGITTTATETTTDANTYDPLIIDALLKSGNPDAIAGYMNQANLSSPNKVVSDAQTNANTATLARSKGIGDWFTAINPFNSRTSTFPKVKASASTASKAASNLALYKAILAQTANAPQVSRKVTKTSKDKT